MFFQLQQLRFEREKERLQRTETIAVSRSSSAGSARADQWPNRFRCRLKSRPYPLVASCENFIGYCKIQSDGEVLFSHFQELIIVYEKFTINAPHGQSQNIWPSVSSFVLRYTGAKSLPVAADYISLNQHFSRIHLFTAYIMVYFSYFAIVMEFRS